jgi:hypothetical protein
LRLEIRADNLPGRRCGPRPEGGTYENIHVGIGRGASLTGLTAGDAPSARWDVEIKTRPGPEGGIDFGGPFVHGPRGERCVYLSWGTVDADGTFKLFRAAKLRLSEIDPGIVHEALQPGRHLVGRLGLTDQHGWPLCASVRPPHIEWKAESNSKAG